MLSTLLTLLIVFIILGLFYWAFHQIAKALGIPAPIVTIVDVVLVFLFVLYILKAFGLLDRLKL